MIKLWICLISFLIFFLPYNIFASSFEDIFNLYKNAQTDGIYLEPDDNELNEAKSIFNSIFKNSSNINSMKTSFDKLHLKLTMVNIENKQYYVISEEKGYKTGRGFYIFPQKINSKNALQMPHSKKDIHTGKIGLLSFLEGEFAAAAFNSVPRNYKHGSKIINADLADFPKSYFISFAIAFARQFPNGYLIQLHGFSTNKRKTNIGKKSRFIVSPGSFDIDMNLKKLDFCLENKFLTLSSLFPIEIRELGGTKNEIGLALRKTGHNNFIHIEINKSIRDKLVSNKNARLDLIKCFDELKK